MGEDEVNDKVKRIAEMYQEMLAIKEIKSVEEYITSMQVDKIVEDRVRSVLQEIRNNQTAISHYKSNFY